MERVVRPWKGLPKEVAASPCREGSNERLEAALSALAWLPRRRSDTEWTR